jgi:glycine/sarcosine N-methyltransferase
MIHRARENARETGRDVKFEVAGFGQHAGATKGEFDAALILGNSLPHIVSAAALDQALADLHSVLKPSGLLFVQNRNFDRVLAQRDRWMPNQEHVEADRQWIFSRFYDWEQDGAITFNVVTLRREGDGPWRSRVDSTRLWPMRHAELIEALERAGFDHIELWGDMQGAEYNAASSPNTIIIARRD